jgi:hypothetical protein
MDRLRALRAYEHARWKQALLLAIPLAIIGGVCGGGGLASLIAATISYGLAVALLHRGEEYGRSVVPGVIAGVVPAALVAVSMRYAHLCVGASCTTVCLAACGVGGVAAAALVHGHAKTTKAPRRAWIGGALIATAISATACSCLGAMGVLALLAGVIVGAWPRVVSNVYA